MYIYKRMNERMNERGKNGRKRVKKKRREREREKKKRRGRKRVRVFAREKNGVREIGRKLDNEGPRRRGTRVPIRGRTLHGRVCVYTCHGVWGLYGSVHGGVYGRLVVYRSAGSARRATRCNAANTEEKRKCKTQHRGCIITAKVNERHDVTRVHLSPIRGK